MNKVVVRRSRIVIETARGPTRSYSPGAARIVAFLAERPDLAGAILPLLHDLDPLLGWCLLQFQTREQSGSPLARALNGAADQITAGTQIVSLSTPVAVSGTDGPCEVHEDDG